MTIFSWFCRKRKVFQQTVGIPVGTNCVPVLADTFLYSYESEFIQSLSSKGKKQLISRSTLTYKYIADVLSVNNPELGNYLGETYRVDLEIKDTTENITSASYLNLLLSIGSHLHLRQTRWFQIPHHNLFDPITDLDLITLPNLTFYPIARGFHRIFATGVACQQRTLTPPDTWSCLTFGPESVLMLRPISPELVFFPDFLSFEQPSVRLFFLPSWE